MTARAVRRRRTVVATIGLAALLAATAGVSCARAASATAMLPHIDSLRPDSVVAVRGAVIEILVVGRGFVAGAPGENAVRVGSATLSHVPANRSGTEIRFVLPDAMPSNGEAPPASLLAGQYAVSVRTSAGESNTMILRVVP